MLKTCNRTYRIQNYLNFISKEAQLFKEFQKMTNQYILNSSEEEVADANKKQPNSEQQSDAGHYNVLQNEIFNSQYIVTAFLNDGTFGRVVEVVSLKQNKTYAMKIIRGVERFKESAKIEASIINGLHQQHGDGKKHIVQIFDQFVHNNLNYCIVFEKLGISLYDLLRNFGKNGLTVKLIKPILKQVLEGLSFIHAQGLTHTDLKPENIMINKMATQNLQSKSSNYDVKIIDFGGATWQREHRIHLINTRQYRAPEVILRCCEWNQTSDMWCLGCIVMEMYTDQQGQVQFGAKQDDFEHLCMIERCCGQFPIWMLNGASPQFSGIQIKQQNKQ